MRRVAPGLPMQSAGLCDSSSDCVVAMLAHVMSVNSPSSFLASDIFLSMARQHMHLA